METFIARFDRLYSKTIEKWREHEIFYNEFQKVKILRVPWGKVLYFAPSNSIIPLLPIVTISFASTGNNLIIVPSRKVKRIAEELFCILRESYGDTLTATLDLEGGKKAIEKYVDKNSVNLVYFQGSSRNRVEIYQKCVQNGIDIVFEGEGNVLGVVDETVTSLENVARIIFKSKLFCNGQLCTSPNILFLQENTLREFMDEYKKLIKKVDRPVRKLIDENLENDLKSTLQKIIPRSLDHYFYDSFDECEGVPVGYVVLNEGDVTKYLNTENFSPILLLATYKNLFDLINLIKKGEYAYGLQFSLFSEKQEEWVKTINSNFVVFRIVINSSPIHQNSLLPWGGYKKSGFSLPLSFLEKATRTVVLEGG
ncbi:MAG: aldehyde dehydrogenase family protein [Acidobacteriota bacterium]|nr:aldehyde dehydrogenase family protein [Acidobacteriota bacterium]